MSDGVITSANANGPLRWAVPGTNITWSTQFSHEPPTFQVIDVTQDSANTYVRTSLSGRFPTSSRSGEGHLGIRVHSAPKFTCTNCTGSVDAVDLSQAPAGAPLWSYSRRTYTGDTNSALVPIWGALSTVKFNVITAYSGTSALNFNIDAFVVNGKGDVVLWNPTITTSHIGNRLMTPMAVIGAQIGDSLTPPGLGTWLVNNQITPGFNPDISGLAPSTWPTVTIEITTDQGVVTCLLELLHRYTLTPSDLSVSKHRRSDPCRRIGP